MRAILSNADALELHALIEDNPGATLELKVIDIREIERNVTIGLKGTGIVFEALARRTPGDAGSLVIEDYDGRRILEAR